MAKCPHCDQTINNLILEQMTASFPSGTGWSAFAYICPLCQKIISAQIDPIAIKTDTVNEMKAIRDGVFFPK